MVIIMETLQHAILYFVSVIGLAIANIWLKFITNWWFFVGMIPMFVINPDLDQIFRKWGIHRSGIFHSVLLPLSLYLPMRSYLCLGQNAGEFCLFLFFSTLIHLVGDMKIWKLGEAFVDDIKEINIKKKEIEKKKKPTRTKDIQIAEGTQDFWGTWLISLPFKKKRLTFYQSLTWLTVNILIMVSLIVIFYLFP